MPEQQYYPEQPTPQQKPSLFGKRQVQTDFSAEFSNQMSNLNQRLRILEERYTNLQRKTQVTDQNLLSNNRKFNQEIKTINSDINEIKASISEIDEKLRQIIKELQASARKEDMDILKRYIDLWDPSNFITRAEVEKIMNELKEESK